MDSIFGVSMNAIMLTLLVIFALCLSLGAWIFLRHRVVFKMGMRNVPRRPAQTTLIIIGLMLSTLIISAALTTGDTLDNSLNGMVYDLMGETDELVVLSSGDNSDTAAIGTNFIPQQVATELESKLGNDPLIEGIMPILSQPVPAINQRTSLTEPALNLTGIDPAKVQGFGGLKGDDGKSIDIAALPAGSVVMGKTAAEKLDAQVGDEITVFAENKPFTLKVAAIAPDSMLTGMTNIGGAGGFVMPLDRAQTILNKPGLIDFVAISNQGGVKSGVDVSDEVTTRLNQALDGTSYRAIAVKKNAVEQAEQAGNIFTSVFLVLGLFSIAAGILLIFLIFVLLAAERKPEMGMARAVGMKRRQLTQMFLAEGIAYDLVAAMVGAALGIGVAFGIAELMGRLVGDFVNIQPVASWRSLVVAYTLGVIVTFITITISSWRVSRLNIVAAIRDIAEVSAAKASNRWLILGILGVVLGVLLMLAGASSKQAFPWTMGISLIPLSLAVALRRFGVPPRPLYTIASLLVLAYWLMPSSWLDGIEPDVEGDMEMFFVSGIMMVSAATIAIIWNAEITTGIVTFFGRSFSRWLPAVKTAVAYPSASRGRTGMTIAMFSLIVFSLVMMATINANFVNIFTTDEAGAGFDIQARQAPNNPIDNFRQTLAAQGVDTSQIAATGRVQTVPQFGTQVRMAQQGNWLSYTVNGMDDSFIQSAEAPLQVRATGYDSDQAVWDALRANPDLAVIDGFAIFTSGFGGDPNAFRLTNVKQGDETMPPTPIEIRDVADGTTRTVTVIGVIDSKVSTLFGIYLSDAGFSQIFERPSTITYFVQAAPGVDVKALANTIEAKLITFGVQAESIKETLEQQSSQSQGFLYLIEGFMGLGLLVGIAALGVISFRSVVERRQQIGMLRAIGYQRNMVSASFLIESSMITILGVSSGVILGLILAYNLMTSPEFSGTAGNTAFVVPWALIVVFIVVSIGAALLMAYIPSRQAARVPIADALRYE